MAQDRRQARGVRAAPPARPRTRPSPTTASRSSGGTAAGGHARAGRALRAAAPRAPRRCGGSSRRRCAACVLKARGLHLHARSASSTGWTYTKVNRCLTEGRQAFLGAWRASRTAPSASGWRRCCRRWPTARPTPRTSRTLRPHLRSCLACRARLREFRAAPARVAALAPAGPRAAGAGRGRRRAALGALQQKVEALLGATQQKAAALGERAHAAVELATGQKVAAVAASAAALAGGGTAVDQLADHHRATRPRPRPSARSHSRARWRRSQPGRVHRRRSQLRPRTPGTRGEPKPRPARPASGRIRSNEFGPSGAPAAAPGSSSTSISTARAGQAAGPAGAATPAAMPEARRAPPESSRRERTPEGVRWCIWLERTSTSTRI